MGLVGLQMTASWRWGLVGAVWVAAAAHTGWSMRRYQRRWWVWFLICLCASPIPAAIVSYVDYFRQLRRSRAGGGAAGTRCPHCRGRLSAEDARRVGGKRVCPHCNMVLEEDYA